MGSAEQVLVLITRALINRSNIVNLQLVIISHPARTTRTTRTTATGMTTIARASPRRSFARVRPINEGISVSLSLLVHSEFTNGPL